MERDVDNTALFLGSNAKDDRRKLEVPIEAAGRVLVKGTLLAQKTADGTLMVEHSLNLALPVAGVTNSDITIPINVAAAELPLTRVYNGHVDEKLVASQNGLASLDIIPAGATLSYRMQLEAHSFTVVYRKNI